MLGLCVCVCVLRIPAVCDAPATIENGKSVRLWQDYRHYCEGAWMVSGDKSPAYSLAAPNCRAKSLKLLVACGC